MTDLRSATGAPADGRTSAAPPLPGLPERRRGPAFALGAVVGAAAAFGLGWWLSDGDGNSDPAAETAELVTVAVERRDLVDDVEWSATLGYGEEITASAATDGTITGAAERGAVLERGDAIAEVDGAPVVVFYGQVPPWRDLAEGEMLDGEGGYTVWGKLMPAADSLSMGALPLGLAQGVKLTRPVAAGAVLARADVALDEADEAVRVRREMEATFA